MQFWNKVVPLLLVSLLLTACVIVPGQAAPGDPKVIIPKDVAEFLVWVDKATPVLVDHFKLSETPITRVSMGFPPTETDSTGKLWIESGRHYRRLTASDLIVIQCISNRRDYTLAELKRTWLHEFVHHFDISQGRGYTSCEHNALFEERIDQLNLPALTAGL